MAARSPAALIARLRTPQCLTYDTGRDPALYVNICIVSVCGLAAADWTVASGFRPGAGI